MRALMAHSVEVWESDPEAFSYHPVGYMQISPEVMHQDVATIAQQQKEIGYTSEFMEGEADCMKYMKGIFSDWQAKGITSVLHEKKGGYANNQASMKGLAAKAQNVGVRILSGVRVKGFRYAGNAVSAVVTDQGEIRTDLCRGGRRPLDQVDMGNAGPAEDHRHQRPRWKDAQQYSHVDLLVSSRRHAGRRSQVAEDE